MSPFDDGVPVHTESENGLFKIFVPYESVPARGTGVQCEMDDGVVHGKGRNRASADDDVPPSIEQLIHIDRKDMPECFVVEQVPMKIDDRARRQPTDRSDRCTQASTPCMQAWSTRLESFVTGRSRARPRGG